MQESLKDRDIVKQNRESDRQRERKSEKLRESDRQRERKIEIVRKKQNRSLLPDIPRQQKTF